MQSNGRWTPSSVECCSCSARATFAFKAEAHDAKSGRKVSIVECKKCQFAWQFPFSRSAEESATVFTTAYDSADHAEAEYFDPVWRARVAKVELDFLDALPIQGRRLLDVGGGDGTFGLAAAQQGWKVTAVDPAINPERWVQDGLTAIRGTTSALSSDAIFDVVTLWDVVEHVEDPAQLLNELRSRVPVGGWLIIETGNYKCAERLRSGVRHWIYQLDHRWYFSPDSLTRLLESEAWQVIDYSKRVLRPDWKGLESYSGPSLRSLLSQCARSPIMAMQHLRRYAQLRTATRWPQSGLEIFCLAARRVA